MKIYNKLALIQQELKAPKKQYNNFGKYNYRSLEDILEAVKPLLKEYKLALKIQDEIVNKGNRFYIKANISLIDLESDEIVKTSALAREAETRKGMDDSQLTSATSSYARKYALNGLFLIDDTKDADSGFGLPVKKLDKTDIVNYITGIELSETSDQLKEEWANIPSEYKLVKEIEQAKNKMKKKYENN